MNGVERAALLRGVATNKLRLALSWPELKRLDQFLIQGFGVQQIPDGCDWWATVTSKCDAGTVREFRKLLGKRTAMVERGESPVSSIERKFYDVVATVPLFSFVHSQKRCIILDAAALLTRVAQEAKLSGAALDIGCNGGYHALWLAASTDIQRVTGIDASGPSIAFAEGRKAYFKDALGPIAVEFRKANFPAFETAERFEMAFSIDGGLWSSNPEALERTANLLVDGGVLVWSSDLPDAALRKAEQLGLGFVFADVLGGWSGTGYLSTPVAVFVKGAASEPYDNFDKQFTRMWDEAFRGYANSGVDPYVKTQAFCRTTKLYGPDVPSPVHHDLVLQDAMHDTRKRHEI